MRTRVFLAQFNSNKIPAQHVRRRFYNDPEIRVASSSPFYLSCIGSILPLTTFWHAFFDRLPSQKSSTSGHLSSSAKINHLGNALSKGNICSCYFGRYLLISLYRSFFSQQPVQVCVTAAFVILVLYWQYKQIRIGVKQLLQYYFAEIVADKQV